MTTTTPEVVCRIKEKRQQIFVPMCHIVKLRSFSQMRIHLLQLNPTRSRVQLSSVRTILKLPSVEIKRSDRCNCDHGDTNWWRTRTARSTKQTSKYKSKYKKSKTSSKKVHQPKLIRVLLDSGSDRDLLFPEKGTPKCFPYSTRQVPKSWCTLNGNFHTEEEVS